MTYSMRRKISRRELLRSSVAGAAGLSVVAIVGCGGNSKEPARTTTPGAEPPTQAPTTAAPETAVSRRAVWSRIATEGDAPGPRRDSSMTAVGPSAIYLFGGRMGGTSNAELWRLDVGGTSWSRIEAPVTPGARFAHNAFHDAGRNRLLITLGQSDGGFFNDVWAYDLAAGTWDRLDEASIEHPEIRYGSGGAYDVTGDRILISHGFTGVGRFDDTWAFDLKTNQWSKIATTGPVPIKRCLLRTLWVPSRAHMLLFGGQTDGTPFLGDFWSLDLAAGMWTENTPPVVPGARNLAGASLDEEGSRWYLTGGNTPDGPTAETWAYDVEGDVWSLVDTDGTPPARYSVDAAVAGGVLYAFGGNDGAGEVGELWGLDLKA